ncbi:hypothetical protein [Pseudosulfitobacter pseudonitzschiae]|uniref:hypothetical protein n=1 Tax=Pseudosulfitobacter pseudonitzschiae TaxID=1402135 RepID=UPI003B7B3AFD
MTLAVLKGVSCPDHRSTLVELNQQGWDIQKTGSGHLKLTHQEAIKPVFSGSTVSDYRARKNLISECRNAIKLSRGTRQDISDPEEMSDADVRNVLQSHKAAKKAKKRRVAGPGFNPGHVATGHSENMKPMTAVNARADTAIPVSALGSNQHSPKNDLQADRAEVRKPLVKKKSNVRHPKPVGMPSATQDQITPANTGQDATTHSGTEEAYVEISTIDTETAAKVTPSVEPIVASPKRLRKAPPAPTSEARITPISPEVMDLALKIASGEYAQMKITPEMVGQTLYYSSDIMMTQTKSSPTSGIEAQPDPAMPARSSKKTRAGKNGLDEINKKIIATIREFAPEAVTQRDLAELLYEELGFKNYGSALASFSRRVTQMCNLGYITEEPKGRLRAFRIKA